MPPKSLLFVCLGNICRSPAAEGVMRHQLRGAGLEKDIRVASAGTLGYHTGELPDSRMRAAALRRGYVLESRAQKFTAADFARYDLIVPMDDDNRRNILALASTEEERARVRPFCTFCTQFPDTFVPDPYYGGPEGFEHVLDLLEDGCAGLLRQLTPKPGL